MSELIDVCIQLKQTSKYKYIISFKHIYKDLCSSVVIVADESLAINVLCGVTAGVVSSTIANPTDVLKVRH